MFMRDRHLGHNVYILDETLPHTKEAVPASKQQVHQIRQGASFKPLLTGLVKLWATTHCVHTPSPDSLQQSSSSNDRQC